jgi:hypothetical protein
MVLSLAGRLVICGAGYAADYAIGADLSFLKQAEDRGTVFKDNGDMFDDDGNALPVITVFDRFTRK